MYNYSMMDTNIRERHRETLYIYIYHVIPSYQDGVTTTPIRATIFASQITTSHHPASPEVKCIGRTTQRLTQKAQGSLGPVHQI